MSILCSSRKYAYPPQGMSLEILRGRGVSKAKIFKGKYEAKLEFPEGWGFKPKNLPWGVWIFSGTTHSWYKLSYLYPQYCDYRDKENIFQMIYTLCIKQNWKKLLIKIIKTLGTNLVCETQITWSMSANENCKNLLVMMELASAKPNREWSVNRVRSPMVRAWRRASWQRVEKAL